jgi:hypothetical protein
MIGRFSCELEYRKLEEGSWVVARRGTATWEARYVLDGHAILDEFIDDEGSAAVNVRIYSTEEHRWKIHAVAVEQPAGGIHNASLVEGAMVMDVVRETPTGFEYTQRYSFRREDEDRYRWTNEVLGSDGASVTLDVIECRRASGT